MQLEQDGHKHRRVMDTSNGDAKRAVAETRGFRLQEHTLALYAVCTRADCPHRPK